MMIKTIADNIRKLFKGKNKKLASIVTSAIFIVIFIVFILNITVQRTYHSYSVIKTQPTSNSSAKGYVTYNEDIIKYSEDGITLMSNDLKTRWSATYSFKNPQVVTSKKYIAVADIGGKDINLYDSKGNVRKIENTREICQIELSDSGMVAVLTRQDMAYYITIVNKTKKYIDIKTRIKEDGYPIDMAYSPDSQKLVTSYMKVEDGVVNTYVTFYNFSEVGKNYESRIAKAESYGSVMVPKVEFIDKSTVVIFSSERFIVYDMKETPEERFKCEKCTNTIKSVMCSDKYIGLITQDSTGDKNILTLYNKDGRKKLSKTFKFNYDNVELLKDDIILRNSTEAMVIRTSGKVKFQGELKEEVEYVLPYNNRDKFIFVTPQSINRIKFVG